MIKSLVVQNCDFRYDDIHKYSFRCKIYIYNLISKNCISLIKYKILFIGFQSIWSIPSETALII